MPPYQTEDVLEYYRELGFDLGVSVDHLIFPEIAHERGRRWDITIQNAEEFLRVHRAGGYRFTPIGVAQGWDPQSYRRAAEALVKMGYDYIAVGGLVRSTTQSILETLTAIKEVLPPHTRVHLFGVNRPEHVATFAALGISSFDSASRLRRAWMDGRHNYFLGNRGFAAIRIPDSASLAKRRAVDLEKARRREQEADALERAAAEDEVVVGALTGAPTNGNDVKRPQDLRAEASALRRKWHEQVDRAEEVGRERRAHELLQAYDRDDASLSEAYEAVAAYARIAGELSPSREGELTSRVTRDYLRTLEDRPWKRCECNVCRNIGVEVVIFRGNNRNRRRGFHNTWQLYRQLAQLPSSMPEDEPLSMSYAQLHLAL